jgi:HD-GYP domain-containing protein (c-di-GMP phosphodiesterase class II)
MSVKTQQTRSVDFQVRTVLKSLSELDGLTHSMEHRSLTVVEALLALIDSIENADPRLRGHGIRTACYAVRLGQTICLTAQELNDLLFASLLHDIGLLTLSKEILLKDRPLSNDEYVLVQSHPRAGAELLLPIQFLRTAALWIAFHHERWDGFGYPYGLRGSLIPLGSRILAVADTYDALTSARPYGIGYARDTAIRLMELVAGSQLDPELVELFVPLVRGPYATVTGTQVGEI